MVRQATSQEVTEAARFAYQLNSMDKHRCKGFPRDYDAILHQFQRIIAHPHSQLLIAGEENQITGVLALFVEPDDQYLQAIGGVFAKENYISIATDFYDYIRARFQGYKMHAAYPKENVQAYDFLISIGAELEDYDCEFRVFKHDYQFNPDTQAVDVLAEDLYSYFILLHNQVNPNVYWTGEKLIKSLDRFKIFAVRKANGLAGFIVTSNMPRRENEIYFLHGDDLEIKKRLLASAIAAAFLGETDELLIMVGNDKSDGMKFLQTQAFRQSDTCLTFLVQF